MYRRGDKYHTKSGRTYFFISQPGIPEGRFTKAIETYCNALINSNGGMLVFGVDNSERVVGFHVNRVVEDHYKLKFDEAIRQMKPTIHPHQYRLDVIYLDNHHSIFEIRMSGGEPQEIYENSKRQMFIVKEKQLYGPLLPCEITQIVLAKYKEELSSLIIQNNEQHIKEQEQVEGTSSKTSDEETHTSKKFKSAKISWP